MYLLPSRSREDLFDCGFRVGVLKVVTTFERFPPRETWDVGLLAALADEEAITYVEGPVLLILVRRMSRVDAGGGVKKPSLSFVPGITGAPTVLVGDGETLVNCN